MSPHASWLLVSEIVPRLSSSIPKSVRPVGCEDWEELIQDGTAIAAQILVSAEAKGKSPSAGNVAFYTTRLLQAGRRSTGSLNADALGIRAQINHRSSVVSMDQSIDGESDGEGFTLADLITSTADDPAGAAMRKIDWELFLGTLDCDLRRLVQWLADGRSLIILARQWKISPASATRRKQRLADAASDFFGADICD